MRTVTPLSGLPLRVSRRPRTTAARIFVMAPVVTPCANFARIESSTSLRHATRAHYCVAISSRAMWPSTSAIRTRSPARMGPPLYCVFRKPGVMLSSR